MIFAGFLVSFFISYIMPFIWANFLEKKNPQRAKDLRWLGIFSLSVIPAIIISLFILPPVGEKGLGIIFLGSFNIIFGWLSPLILSMIEIFGNSYGTSDTALVSHVIPLMFFPITMLYIYVLYPQKSSLSFLITRSLLFSWIANILFYLYLAYWGP